MRVFLASSYHSGSHRAWAEGYAGHSAHDVHLVTLPGSFWQWRLTGGFVSLSAGVVESAALHGRPDVILVASLVDVAGLRGLVSKELGVIPTALYMHENQVTYPAVSRSRTERNYGLINWTSLVASDAVAFNSVFHRDALFGALDSFLGEFPDERHHDLLPSVKSKVSVLPVGCELGQIPSGPKGDLPLVVWNHRWDPDKAPAAFLRIMSRVAADATSFRIALCGERFVNQRTEHDAAVAALGDLVVIDEYLGREAYLAVLAEADIVVSTALQEFFGVSVVEAMAARAAPILPRRLVYPERVPADLADRLLYDTEDDAVTAVIAALEDLPGTRRIGSRLGETVGEFDWSVVAPAYDDWLASIVPS